MATGVVRTDVTSFLWYCNGREKRVAVPERMAQQWRCGACQAPAVQSEPCRCVKRSANTCGNHEHGATSRRVYREVRVSAGVARALARYGRRVRWASLPAEQRFGGRRGMDCETCRLRRFRSCYGTTSGLISRIRQVHFAHRVKPLIRESCRANLPGNVCARRASIASAVLLGLTRTGLAGVARCSCGTMLS